MNKRLPKTPIIDSQVHVYERDHAARPWIGTLHGPAEVTGDDMVTAMDAVGVDGAILVSPWSMYRYDASYALEVYALYPDRFRLVKPFDHRQRSVAEDVAEWANQAGAVGARIVLMDDTTQYASDAGLNAMLASAALHGLPVNVMCWGQLNLFYELAGRHPNAQIVLDHLGLPQPFEPPPPADPFAELDAVVNLAALDNVAIKISGACTLSKQSFPYADLWAPLHKIFDAFGFERCMWGTDWTRAVELLSYEQGVEAFHATDELSEAEHAALMGGSLMKIYNFSPCALSRE